MQYPHSITFNWKSPATQDEETGNMIPGEVHNVVSNCRAEPNGTGKTIPSQDGTLISYSYTVYMPIKQFFPVGAKATVTLGERIVTASVKSSHVGFFNTRVWL